MSETAVYTGGKARSSETIYLGNTIYINVKGKWQISKMTRQDIQHAKKEAPHERRGQSRGGGILGVFEERPQSAWLLGDTGCTAFEKVRDQKIGTFRRRVQKKRKQSPVYAIVII